MENNKRTSFDTVSKGKIHLLDKGLYIGTDIDPTVIVGRRIAVFRKFGKEQFILCRGTTVKHIVTLPDQQISIFPGQILIQRIQIRSFLQFFRIRRGCFLESGECFLRHFAQQHGIVGEIFISNPFDSIFLFQ